MAKMIFVNLPVADVAQSTAFYEAIGFEKNAKFSNEQASSMMWSGLDLRDAAEPRILLHLHPQTDRRRQDDERRAVRAVVRQPGGRRHDHRRRDRGRRTRAARPGGHGFMYSRAFEDLDGHVWEPIWMDPARCRAAGPPSTSRSRPEHGRAKETTDARRFTPCFPRCSRSRIRDHCDRRPRLSARCAAVCRLLVGRESHHDPTDHHRVRLGAAVRARPGPRSARALGARGSRPAVRRAATSTRARKRNRRTARASRSARCRRSRTAS